MSNVNNNNTIKFKKSRKHKTIHKKSITITNNRKKYGGETMRILASIKANNQLILAEIDKLENGLSEKCNASGIRSITKIKDFAMQGSQEINDLLSEQQQKLYEEEIDPMNRIITIHGFTGSVDELLDNIKKKIQELNKKNSNVHDEMIQKLNRIVDNISIEITSINKIKQILKNEGVTFQDNKVFGGKQNK
jgi:hypothetical protein